ncbi:MAG: asparagine synthase B [Actinobacteria bacterium]|nr:asparagine synthase B [Actinomycetota bacterium]
MCGIVAQHGAPDPVAGRRMLRRLAHRGPDDADGVTTGPSWLGHRRLSIVDVEGGRQPLSTPDGRLHLVGNGEIYNHAALGCALSRERFSSESDNEVALHLFDQYGPAALADMRGMFALCIGGDDGRFLAARDPVGVKPLYWARREGRVVFASELRAYDPDWRGDVELFPPGHYWTPAEGLVRFASISRHEPDGAWAGDGEPGSAVLGRIRETLESAIRRRMMADVPVGVLLSGGLDSSLVAVVAAEHARRAGMTLRTFAVGTPTSPDLAAARGVARLLGSEHHERVYTAEEAVDVVEEVVAAIESYEPSLVRSAVPNFLLAELAATHVKVVLTGEGADELFAGYEYLRGVDDEALHTELRRTVEGLHKLNLQRCDRVTMAHGLEARVPFLDLDVIALGLSLPVEWKIASDGRMEKHLLRTAFEDALPEEILWRRKAQFGDGSGAAEVLREHVAAAVSDADLDAARTGGNGGLPAPRTREELAYQRMFRRHLGGVRPERVLGRFATA